MDTNVISAGAPSVIVPPAELVEWIESQLTNLFVSVVTIAGVAEGIAKAKRKGARRKASDLSARLQTLLHLYGERVLPFDTPTAEIAVFWPIWRAAAVILRVLLMSLLPQRLVDTT